MRRREFIQCAIGMACLWPRFNQAGGEEHGVRLLPAAEGDLAGEESERGFAQALDRLLPTHTRLGRAVIVPSASALEGTALSSLVRQAQLGATVLIDLADGFACRSDIARTRIDLKRHLGDRGRGSGRIRDRRLHCLSMARPRAGPPLYSN